MELWSVHERPAEDRCTVLKVLVEEDGLQPMDEQLFRSVHEARSALARRGLVRVPRGDEDDPSLIETWL